LDKELGFKFTQSKWFTQPLALAVFAAAVAGGANVGVSWLNNEGQLQVERVRDEASRIVSAISTNDPDRAATNLKFLLDVGLLHDEQTVEGLKAYLKNRKPGEGPSLPAISSLLSSFSEMESVDFESEPEGASVIASGQMRGKTPLRAIVSPGSLSTIIMSLPGKAPCSATNWVVRPASDKDAEVVTCIFTDANKSP
jgi:hypothetical protein